MSTLAIVAIVVGAVILLALIYFATRGPKQRRAQDRRHREVIGRHEAERERAEAEAHRAKARAAHAEEQRLAHEHERRADEIEGYSGREEREEREERAVSGRETPPKDG